MCVDMVGVKFLKYTVEECLCFMCVLILKYSVEHDS